MDVRSRLVEQLVVRPGEAAGLVRRDPGGTGAPDVEDLTRAQLVDHARGRLARGTEELSDAQELLWASDRYALLVVPVEKVRLLDLHWLTVAEAQRAADVEARRKLEAETS